MNLKNLQIIYYVNVNINLMLENVTQIKTRVTIIIDMSAKILVNMCVKKGIFGILVQVPLTMVHI